MQTAIRRVTAADAVQLASIGSRTFYETFSGTCTEEDMEGFLHNYFNLQQVQKELADEDDYFFFAEVEGEAVGYVRIKEDYTHFDMMKQWKALELKRIYVDKAYFGKGIAQALMDFVEVFAADHQYQVIWLGVWEHNIRAKKFYEKSGFKDSGYMHDFPIGNTPQRDHWLWKFLDEKNDG